MSLPALNACLPICDGLVWVRFFGRIRVFDSARADFWVRFVILRLGGKAVLPGLGGLALLRLRKRTLRAATRPFRYITPRVIAGRSWGE